MLEIFFQGYILINITLNIAQKMRKVKLFANDNFCNYLINKDDTNIIIAINPANPNTPKYSITSVAIAFADSLFVVLIPVSFFLYYKRNVSYFLKKVN
jgi:hypothetical protein